MDEFLDRMRAELTVPLSPKREAVYGAIEAGVAYVGIRRRDPLLMALGFVSLGFRLARVALRDCIVMGPPAGSPVGEKPLDDHEAPTAPAESAA